MSLRIILLGWLVLLSTALADDAVTVYFNDADRNPAPALQIGGVTISLSPGGSSLDNGQPTTVAGLGLGLDEGIGLTGEVNEQIHFPACSSSADQINGGDGLSFSVDGWIDSITLLPVLRSFDSVGNSLSVPANFMLEFSRLQVGPKVLLRDWPLVPASSPMPFLLNSAECAGKASVWDLTPQPNWDPSVWFANCRSDYLNEEQTIQWGFTVVSLEYTPADIPEPGSVTLFLAGLIGLLCRHHGWSLRH